MKKLRINTRWIALLMGCLFLGLAAYFSYSVYFYGGRWFASANNPRLREQKQRVIAGDLLDRNGIVLATTREGERVYPAAESVRRAVAHVVGDSGGIVANGAETFMASYLLGFKAGAWQRVQQLFSAEPARGDEVRLTIDANLCTYAAGLLDGYEGGAVVVLNYKNGQILCDTSMPDFDPADVGQTMNSETDDGAFVNRTTQGLYPPGSTFKVITMAAALENLPDVTLRKFYCAGTLPIDRTTITEASGQVHGSLTMEQAFARSCNAAFAALSLEMGYDMLSKTATNFGFGDNFLFRDLVVYNAQYPTTRQSPDDLAWSGIGQGRVLVTPLHMAMIAGAVGNGGIMMEPRLMLSATNAQGLARTLLPERPYKRACEETTAATLAAYMRACVQSGTGTRAQISGYTVAGKTGTAEVSDDKTIQTHAWFIGYIESDEYPLAIAVLVERGGSGGSVAAPIAQKVLSRAIGK
ncbi:MAG: penicillin-binding protein 2 [Oscillospiraceae bacterium]|jgi:peptidoglycan glycosyltransferase|nr:penicillin-binding protein 2 [Oscillospiraceae bacterium]